MKNQIRIAVIVNDFAREFLGSQHGLSLVLEQAGKKWLFDTGAGNLLLTNLNRMGEFLGDMNGLILSHGHYDHTGGLAELLARFPQSQSPSPFQREEISNPAISLSSVQSSPRMTTESSRFSNPSKDLSPLDLPRSLDMSGPVIKGVDSPNNTLLPEYFTIWYAPGVDKRRYTCPMGAPVREISMPEDCRNAFHQFPASQKHCVRAPMRLSESLFLTGALPRNSEEDCGGPFYLDQEKIHPDEIDDEQSLICQTDAGNILITGCCHAGLINSVEYCLKLGFPIHALLGGVHLNRATDQRLASTVEYLNSSDIRQLYLTHCSGENAIRYLTNHFRGTVKSVVAGDTLIF